MSHPSHGASSDRGQKRGIDKVAEPELGTEAARPPPPAPRLLRPGLILPSPVPGLLAPRFSQPPPGEWLLQQRFNPPPPLGAGLEMMIQFNTLLQGSQRPPLEHMDVSHSPRASTARPSASHDDEKVLGQAVNLNAQDSHQSTPCLPESGPGHDVGVDHSQSIQQLMEDDLIGIAALQNMWEASNEIPGPLLWDELDPDWMPPVNARPTARPVPSHGRTVTVKADKVEPRTALDRLELFQALFPSLHYRLKGVQDQPMWLYLDFSHEEILDKLRKKLIKDRKQTQPKDEWNSDGLPQVGRWYDHIDDWDIDASCDTNVREMMLTNWDNPAREQWKHSHCRLLFDVAWAMSSEGQTFVENGELRQDGLPRAVRLVVRVDNGMYIVGMLN